MSQRRILIVDDDEVLGRVLGRVLGQQGYQVALATNVAEAQQRVSEDSPNLALLDLSLPDGDGTDLGRDLHARFPGMQQILMTGYPLRLRDHPELSEGFAKVFTKPLDLKELRQTVESLMNPERTAAGAAGASPEPVVSNVLDERSLPGREAPARSWLRLAGILLALALLAAGSVAAIMYLGLPSIQDLLNPKPAAVEPEKPPLARLAPHNNQAILLPEDVAKKLGIETVTAQKATSTRPLAFDGYLGYDPNQTVTINTLFTGQIEKLIDYPDPAASLSGETVERPVQFKDTVKKNQVLAVLYSKDLGEKKSELVNAWSQYNLDQKYYEEFEQLYKRGLTSEANVLQYRAAVQQDLNAVDKARRTLAVWQVSEEDMEALQQEAERLLKMNVSERAQFKEQKKASNWAKVEIKAPFEGIVVEKNIAPGQIVDPTKDLYKIARPDHMVVYAHAYEDALPALLQLRPEDRRWKVRVNADPNLDLPEGRITTIGSVDPNQHTVPLMGTVPNPLDARGERPLISGQFVTATLQIPAGPQEVAIPTAALIEGSGDSVVLIQPDPHVPLYELRRVNVLRRTRDVVVLRWMDPSSAVHLLGAPAGGLAADPARSASFRGQVNPGQRVVTNGSLLLLSELMDLQSKEKTKG